MNESVDEALGHCDLRWALLQLLDCKKQKLVGHYTFNFHFGKISGVQDKTKKIKIPDFEREPTE